MQMKLFSNEPIARIISRTAAFDEPRTAENINEILEVTHGSIRPKVTSAAELYSEFLSGSEQTGLPEEIVVKIAEARVWSRALLVSASRRWPLRVER